MVLGKVNQLRTMMKEDAKQLPAALVKKENASTNSNSTPLNNVRLAPLPSKLGIDNQTSIFDLKDHSEPATNAMTPIFKI